MENTVGFFQTPDTELSNKNLSIIKKFEDMIHLSDINCLDEVVIDGSVFESRKFSELNLFYQIYYLNRFEFILNLKRMKELCIYTKVIFSIDEVRSGNIPKKKSLRIDEKLLILDRPDKSFVVNNAPLFARFKAIHFKKYDQLFYLTYSQLTEYIETKKVDRVLFILPYRNLLKKTLLKTTKKLEIPFYIFERGALPGTFCFDDQGFNFDSHKYDQIYWDQSYSEKEVSFTKNKVQSILDGMALEAQASDQLTSQEILKIKNSSKGRKIIFVPLQRPWDSVIRYFNPRGYYTFIREILKFGNEYGEEYFVVFKKHPLEKKWPININRINHDNFYFVDDSAHINEILKISSAVALINSGVGVLSLIFNKRVFYFGQIFYRIQGCNNSFSTSQKLKEKLDRPEVWNHDLAFKFLCYLYNRYYAISEKVMIPDTNKWVLKYTEIDLS